MNKKIRYSCVIPLFNESANLRPLYKRLSATLKRLNLSYEIIFVDDGSADDSYQVLKDIAFADTSVKVLSFVRNFGQHKAAIAGIETAGGDYVITMDADLQNPPEEIPRLLEKMKEGFDMVSGYRKMRKDTLPRRLCSSLVNLIISARTGLRMKDYGSMLRVFESKTAKGLADEFRKTEGYITMLVAKVTHNVAEIEVAHDERFAGESRYTIRKLFPFFLKVLFCYNRHSAINREEPLYIIRKRIEDAKEVIVTA